MKRFTISAFFVALLAMSWIFRSSAAPSEAAAPAQPETGYRETAHVRKFYETAKF